MKIENLASAHVPQASALLAARHGRDRQRLAEFLPRMAALAEAEVATAAAWQRPRASGVAALEGG